MRFRRIITILHKWLGLALSLWLLLIALTGTLLLFKTELLQLTYPQLNLSAIPTQQEAAKVFDQNPANYAFLPSDYHPWIETVDDEGTHRYYSAEGELLLSRSAMGDWIEWMVEFHHHLFLHELGKELQGIFGIGCLFLIFSGLIKWWPRKRWSKKDFSIRLSKPGQKQWGQTLWQSHRTFGVVLFFPILIVVATGTAMIYSSAVGTALKALFPLQGEERPVIGIPTLSSASWQERFAVAEVIMPEARPKLISWTSSSMRMTQPEEWHKNGRTRIAFDPETHQVTEWTNIREQTLGYRLAQKVYPLHIANIGGNTYLTLIFLSGVALILLSVTGVWFWSWYQQKRKGRNGRLETN